MLMTKNLAIAAPCPQKDKWETPDWLFNLLNDEFQFTMDPCCEESTARCDRYFTEEDNGLVESWKGNVCFVNPPYSRERIGLWASRCYQMSLEPNTIVVALIPVSTSARWFHESILNKGQLRWVRGRLRFKGAPHTAPFSSVVVVFGSEEKDITIAKPQT